MFTVMKLKEFNLQFMREANQNQELAKMHQINKMTAPPSTKNLNTSNFGGANNSPKTKYNTGYVLPSTQSTIPSSKMIPSFNTTAPAPNASQYLLRHQNENKSQTSFIISYKQHLKLPQ